MPSWSSLFMVASVRLVIFMQFNNDISKLLRVRQKQFEWQVFWKIICTHHMQLKKWHLLKYTLWGYMWVNDLLPRALMFLSTNKKPHSCLFLFGDCSDWCEPYNFTFKFATSKDSFSSWHQNAASENQTVITNRELLHSDIE